MADKIVKIAECIKPFKDVANIGGLAVGFPLIGTFLERSADSAAQYAKSVSKGLETTDDITDLKKQIGDELGKTNKKFVIVIDDIDRLQDGEVSEIFRLVKIIADFNNTIYLLAYDREQVATALDQYYHSDGDKFIEKIVQQEILINHVQKDTLNKYVLKKINEIATESSNEQTSRFTNIWPGLSLAFTNIRDVKRFINSYEFLYSHTKNELNPVDLMAVVALQIKAPKHLTFLRENGLKSISGRTDATVQEWKEFVLRNGGETDWRCLLLNALMPNASTTSTFDNSDIEKECLFYSEKHFHRYFTFAIAEGEISEAMYNLTMDLKSLDEIIAHFTKFEKEGMLRDLIEGLRLRSSEIKPERISNFIISLLKISTDNKEEKEELFGLNIRDSAFLLARLLFEQFPNAEAKTYTLEKVLCMDEFSLFIQVKLLDYLGQDFGYLQQRGRRPKLDDGKIFLPIKKFNELKQQCLDKLIGLTFPDHLDDPYFMELCFDLRAWGEENILQTIRNQISELPDGLLCLAELSFSRHWTTGPKKVFDAFRLLSITVKRNPIGEILQR